MAWVAFPIATRGGTGLMFSRCTVMLAGWRGRERGRRRRESERGRERNTDRPAASLEAKKTNTNVHTQLLLARGVSYVYAGPGHSFQRHDPGGWVSPGEPEGESQPGWPRSLGQEVVGHSRFQSESTRCFPEIDGCPWAVIRGLFSGAWTPGGCIRAESILSVKAASHEKIIACMLPASYTGVTP